MYVHNIHIHIYVSCCHLSVRCQALCIHVLQTKCVAVGINICLKCLVSFFFFFWVTLYQRNESNGILARNVEFSQLIIDYQRKLRESSESLHAAEELSRKLNMEVMGFRQIFIY